jgi:hypothetical protein
MGSIWPCTEPSVSGSGGIRPIAWYVTPADRHDTRSELGTRGFAVQPRRWAVERSLAWISRNRRLAKDYERLVQTSQTLIELAVTRLVLRRHAGRLRGPIPLAARW